MANRLKPLLDLIIEPNQVGFTPNRHIQDNIIATQELFNSINRKKRGHNLILKIDLEKAFDKADWGFLLHCLDNYGFDAPFISKINNLINNNWFSIIINGDIHGFFKSNRGLRQGDPLSPILFNLLLNYWSYNLNQMFELDPSLHFHIGGKFQISHLAYADDLIIFTNTDKRSLKKLQTCLALLEKDTGLNINFDKSHFFLPDKASNNTSDNIKHILGLKKGTLPIKFLGIPIFKGHKKNLYFKDLYESINQKIRSWDIKTLSSGGRLILIKHVLNTIPIFWMAVCSPTNHIIRKIEVILNKFLWSFSNQKGMIWCNWKEVTFPYEEGGIGIRNLQDIMVAYSLKLWWDFRTSKALWVSILKAKYCATKHPCTVNPKPTDSPFWSRLLEGRNKMEELIFWKTINNESSFWHDQWLTSGPLYKLTQVSFPNMKIQEVHNQSTWNLNFLSTILNRDIISQISSTHLNWSLNSKAVSTLCHNNNLCFQKVWAHSRTHRININTTWYWHPLIPNNISVFIWRIYKNYISADINMMNKGYHMASKCQCCANSETPNHIFLTNPHSHSVWQYFKPIGNNLNNFFEITDKLNSWGPNKKRKLKMEQLLAAHITWNIWQARNNSKYNNRPIKATNIIDKSILDVQLILNFAKSSSISWKGDTLDIWEKIRNRY